MKQRLRKLLSGFLCIALIASAFVGALSASVLPASADPVYDYGDGYLDDLFAAARLDCPSTYLSSFDSIAQQIRDNFAYWLVTIICEPESHNWYFACYEAQTNKTVRYWSYFDSSWILFYARYDQDYYDHNFYSRYGFKISGGSTFVAETNGIGLGNTNFNTTDVWVSSGWTWCVPKPFDFNVTGRQVYSNTNLRAYNGGSWRPDESYEVFLYWNLVTGSAPPSYFDFEITYFNLGSRSYISILNQEYMRHMQDDYYGYFWTVDYYSSNIDDSGGYFSIYYDDLTSVPYANFFINDIFTNVSSDGNILCFDVTGVDIVEISSSTLYHPTTAEVNPTVAGVCTNCPYVLPSGPDEDSTVNDTWTYIVEYVNNYPSVTVAPQQLADQLNGQYAVGYGMGGVRAPNQIQQWMNLVYYDTDYFQYDLSIGGLDASYESIINFEILDPIIVPAENVLTSTSIDYWDHTYQLDNGTIDTYHIGSIEYINPLFEQYDLILITKSNAQFMGDVSQPYNLAINGSRAYVGDIQRTDIAHDLYYEPVYWVLTYRAIQKSQLYVFCDSQSKLYKLLSDYINKRDLWDSSFFDFTMTLFYQLETINGYLLRFEQEYKSWDLANKLSSIVTSLQEISDNTSETDVDPWYLALFNWIKAFEPSNFDFIGWVDEYDDFVDELPDPGGATIIPFPTAAPTALPTVAVAGG